MQRNRPPSAQAVRVLRALAVAPVSVVNIMHARPDVVLESMAVIREHWAGPVGVYAETGEVYVHYGEPDDFFAAAVLLGKTVPPAASHLCRAAGAKAAVAGG